MKKTIIGTLMLLLMVSMVSARLGPELIICGSSTVCTKTESEVVWDGFAITGWFWDTDDGPSRQWLFGFNDKYYQVNQTIAIKNNTRYNVSFSMSDFSIPTHSLKMELGGVNTTPVLNPSTFSTHSEIITTINDNGVFRLWSFMSDPFPGSIIHIGDISVREVLPPITEYEFIARDSNTLTKIFNWIRRIFKSSNVDEIEIIVRVHQ